MNAPAVRIFLVTGVAFFCLAGILAAGAILIAHDAGLPAAGQVSPATAHPPVAPTPRRPEPTADGVPSGAGAASGAAASPTASQVDALLARLSPADKVGQLLMFGFNGTDPAGAAALLDQDRVGGVVLLGRNVSAPAQLAALDRRLQERAKAVNGVPLLISVDQEGGEVVRITDGATVLPAEMAIGASQDRDLAYRAGQVSGLELPAMGVNMVLAPVLDVNDNPDNPVIGLRSYGERPELVSALGEAYIRGAQEKGLLAVAKHFPGHGSTGVDSHLELPVVRHTRAEIDGRELVPFRAAIQQGVAGVMIGHLLFPALDPDLPATVSPKVIDGLLRKEMGYDGLVLTDDLEMAGIAGQFGTAGAAVRAIQAGADIVIVGSTRERQVETRQALLKAVERGEISRERLDASVRRILRAKERAGLFENPPPVDLAAVGSPANRAVAQQASRAAITVVQSAPGQLPAKASGARVLVVAPTRLPSAGNSTLLAEAVRTRGAQVQEIAVDLDSDASKTGALSRAPDLARAADLILLGTWDAGPYQTALVRALERTGRPLVVIGFGEPYELAQFPEVPTYLAAYGRTPDQVTAAVAVVFGEAKASGRLPVSIAGVAQAAPFAP